MLVDPGGQALVQPVVSGLVIVAGIMIQLSAKLVLFRSFGIVAANRGVKRDGPYRLVRHPMYLGYVVAWVGFLLNNPTLWNATIYLACLALMIGRILAEERILSEDGAYRDLRSMVRYRLAPGVW
jgi:protein-S-isoprenylcysteine O-methyltransferase Ste14